MSPLLMIPLVSLQIALSPAPSADPSPDRPLAAHATAAASPIMALKENPQTAKLRKTIDSMIAMLEAGESRSFLERYVEPEFRQRKGVDAILEEFDREKADLLLDVLKEIRNKKPSYSRGGSRATYKIKTRPIAHGSIKFIRVDGLWYVMN